MSVPNLQEFVVLGGGVLGLSVARELAARGAHATLVERDVPEQGQASRGGAATRASLGVLTAPTSGKSPFKRLQGLGHRTYPALARTLLEETGIDIGYRVTGSLHLKPALPTAVTRSKVERIYREAGLEARWVQGEDLRVLAPGLLDGTAACFPIALHVRDEAIVHPPALASALRASCERRGVVIREGVGEARLRGSEHSEVELPGGEVLSSAGVILTAGSWSRLALAASGFQGLAVRPIRGQAIEVSFPYPECPNLRFEPPAARKEYHIVSKGSGRAWIGSTVEDAGFDAGVTKSGVEELLLAARYVLPGIGEKDVVRAWAGLRPQALRVGGPFLGRLPGCREVWVACGHYRSGILTGPASASLLVREIFGEEIPVAETGLDRQSLQVFRLDR